MRIDWVDLAGRESEEKSQALRVAAQELMKHVHKLVAPDVAELMETSVAIATTVLLNRDGLPSISVIALEASGQQHEIVRCQAVPPEVRH
jgi:hypothetical protein